MSYRFKIQCKHEVEYAKGCYFSGDELDLVIEFLNDHSQCCDQVNAIGYPDSLLGHDQYEIDDALINDVLNRIKSGEIPGSEIPVDKEEMVRFLEACVENGAKTHGCVYLDVFCLSHAR